MEKESSQNSNNQIPESRAETQEIHQPATQTPRKKSWQIISLSILVLVLFSTTGFLTYQNHQLRQQVQKIETVKPVLSPSPTIFPTPTTESDSSDNWKGYGCTIPDYFLNKIKNNSVVSDNPNLGCSIPVTYCKNQICTAPIERIECGQSKMICNVEFHCSCP